VPERIHLQVRLPKPLRDALVKLAEENGHSLNAEIVFQLEMCARKGLWKEIVPQQVKFAVDPPLSELGLGNDFLEMLTEKVAQRIEERQKQKKETKK